ncbi:MAG: zf-HC2 domain-containing protein [Chloroflexota bacterium]
MFGFLKKNPCKSARQDISAYLDGQLGADHRKALEKHLELCEACRRELSQIRETVVLLRRLPRVSPRRSFTLSEEQTRVPVPAKTWQPALASATAIAAVLLALLFAGDFLQVLPPEPLVESPLTLESGGEAEDLAVAEHKRMRAAAPAQATSGARPEPMGTAPAPAPAPQKEMAPVPDRSPDSRAHAPEAPVLAPPMTPSETEAEVVGVRPVRSSQDILRGVEMGLGALVLVLAGATILHWYVARKRVKKV